MALLQVLLSCGSQRMICLVFWLGRTRTGGGMPPKKREPQRANAMVLGATESSRDS